MLNWNMLNLSGITMPLRISAERCFAMNQITAAGFVMTRKNLAITATDLKPWKSMPTVLI
jgi:hypothetical protein